MHSKRGWSQAWQGLRDDLSRALYEYDPEGMGSSVGAPDDEYDGGAIDLIRGLQGQRSRESVAQVVRGLWPEATDELVTVVEQTWHEYTERALPGA